MNRRLGWILLLVLVPVAFLAGLRLHRTATSPTQAENRRVLYWVDPMNPAIHVDGPGIAPCGMPYEPVYADGRPATTPAGSVNVAPSLQQLAGVRVETAGVRPVSHTLRLLGRVTADETGNGNSRHAAILMR